MTPGAFPNFVVIGAQKSATRWLRLNLGQHPDVFTAPMELEFFNHNWKKGAGWYYEKFADANGASAVGEATPGYMMWNERPDRQAARIDGFLPDAKLLAILRNPIDRSYSAFIHFLGTGNYPADASFLEHVRSVAPEHDPHGIIAGSWYGACLEPYVRRFGERLLILQQDDASLDPLGVYRRALRHIGVDHSFVAPDLRKVRFSNPTPEASRYSDEKGKRRELTFKEREELFEYFRDDLDRLADLADVNVDRWKP